MAELILSGVSARCMEPNDLGAVVQAVETRKVGTATALHILTIRG